MSAAALARIIVVGVAFEVVGGVDAIRAAGSGTCRAGVGDLSPL